MTSSVLCAWCQPKVTVLGTFESETGEASHGICEKHLHEQLAEIEQAALDARRRF
jgi:hypothetical protein